MYNPMPGSTMLPLPGHSFPPLLDAHSAVTKKEVDSYPQTPAYGDVTGSRGPANAAGPAQEAMIKVKTPLKLKYWRNGRRNLQCFPSCKVFGDYSAIKIEDLKQHDFMWGKCRGSLVTEVTLNSNVTFDDLVLLGRVHSLENIPVAFEEAVIRECMLGRTVEPDEMDTMKDQWITGERLPDFVQQDTNVACFEFKPKVWKYTEDMAQGKCKRRNVKYYVQFEAFVQVMAGDRRYYACIGSGMSTSFEVGSSRVLARQKRKAASSAPDAAKKAAQADVSTLQPAQTQQLMSPNANPPIMHNMMATHPMSNQIMQFFYECAAARAAGTLLQAALLLVLARVTQGSSIRALDGLGQPVAWWAVLKLPAHVQQSPDSTVVIPTPCDCPPPDCSNVATADWPALEARASGLCYLYADARHPEFRHFRDLDYGCLGQGGNDPVSHTLKQKDADNNDLSPYWALFNDQLNGIAAAFRPNQIESDASEFMFNQSGIDLDQLQLRNSDSDLKDDRRVCGGGDLFSAHAKGAVAFEKDGSGGFFLQTSTPNFPDPTLNESFVRLGCQMDNNVHFAQHMLALSLEDNEMRELGEKLQLARLCSGNFFRNESLHDLLASASLYADGPNQENTSASAFYRALLDPELPEQKSSDPMKNEFRLKLSQLADSKDRDTTKVARRQIHKSAVFEPLAEGQRLYDLVTDIDGEPFNDVGSQDDNSEVLVLVKGPRAAVPPWALVAEALDSDLSVASWWDGSYGIPTICAGDVFTNTPNEFCLNSPPTGVRLNEDGSAPYNIENLLQATWQMSDGGSNLTWQLVGGRVSDGNHAKWGITTPRSGHVNASSAFVTFGDLNMEGFPCSKTCNGSQAGRGGSFFSLMQPSLHQSLATSVISRACKCSSPPDFIGLVQNGPDFSTFEELRMCHRGCRKKLEKNLTPDQLPTLSGNASSFWSK
ncbi:hypothetical protein JM18_001546 [Phytophthora kernoviae]|uniref:Uncharacterized protein n=2 Tax=Phytophthora kernoviae TaxID=325452 RepID=A0A8T0M9Z5_9STRA|nr:hypothetical protein G195_002226 [Phytophthora kernoviae 00238/432]KAG2531258.1 hypothetical protein JM16_001189 [Phytophthora kernoviae]KAG2531871.1 hypothetical protein JM18_001546 [Phytophthora kernoviae]